MSQADIEDLFILLMMSLSPLSLNKCAIFNYSKCTRKRRGRKGNIRIHIYERGIFIGKIRQQQIFTSYTVQRNLPPFLPL